MEMQAVKQRILTNWTFRRALYVALGAFVIINSIVDQQWVGVIFGTYFASMGLFAFGCASGACFSGNSNTGATQPNNTAFQEVEFEEVKTK
jgi:hypothetical protein